MYKELKNLLIFTMVKILLVRRLEKMGSRSKSWANLKKLESWGTSQVSWSIGQELIAFFPFVFV